MASGYLNHPGSFEARVDAEGFYHSGDRGRIAGGRLHLVGRTQDHINVAGRKIDPTEIVALVTALDGVEDALAFPDEDLNREALVHLALPPEFSDDCTEYGLHPALLDFATAGAQALIPDFSPAETFYVPLSYGRLRPLRSSWRRAGGLSQLDPRQDHRIGT